MTAQEPTSTPDSEGLRKAMGTDAFMAERNSRVWVIDNFWCSTCDCTHISEIPVVTFRCTCGYTCWRAQEASLHADTEAHDVYPVTHVAAHPEPDSEGRIPYDDRLITCPECRSTFEADDATEREDPTFCWADTNGHRWEVWPGVDNDSGIPLGYICRWCTREVNEIPRPADDTPDATTDASEGLTEADPMDVRAVVHVEIPANAPDEAVDALVDVIAEAAYSFDREGWDPFVHAYTGGSCEDDQAAREAAAATRARAEGGEQALREAAEAWPHVDEVEAWLKARAADIEHAARIARGQS